MFVHQRHRPLLKSIDGQKQIDTLQAFMLNSNGSSNLLTLNYSLEIYLQAGNINVWGKNKNMLKYLVHLISQLTTVEVVNKTQ